MFITFLKKRTEVFNKKLFLLYFAYISGVIVISLAYSYFYIEKFDYQINENNEIILKNIPFDYGPLIENLFYYNKFEQEWFGVTSYLTRLPFLPYILVIILKISQNLFFVITFKNIIFFSLIFLCCKFYANDSKYKFFCIFILLSIFFINFYNLTVLTTYVFADAYISILLPCIFILLASKTEKKHLIISILLFFLFFTKTTMFFLTISIGLIFFLFEKQQKKLIRIMPIFSIIVAILIWGIFGYIKTQKFPFGSTMLSTNQEALTIVLNKDFKEYYPKISVDYIPRENIDGKFKNEWEYDDYFKKKNLKYFNENKKDVLIDILIKIKFILFNYKKDGLKIDFKNIENKIVFSHIQNRIIFIVSIIILARNLYRNYSRKEIEKINIYYFFIIIFSLMPHIIGWATSKHLVPLFLVSYIYLILNLKSFKNLTR